MWVSGFTRDDFDGHDPDFTSFSLQLLSKHMNELERKACFQNVENIIKKRLCMYYREHLNAEGASVFHFKFNSAERVRRRMWSFLFLDGGKPVNRLHKLIFVLYLL